jgi:hypothetical protein
MRQKLLFFIISMHGFCIIQLKAQTDPKCYPEINNSTTNSTNSTNPKDSRSEPWINLGELLLVITYRNKQHDKNLSRNCRK